MTVSRFLPVTLVLALSLAVMGCQPEAKPAPTPGTTGGTAPVKQEEKPDLATVAAELKHDGYKYYGVECKSTLTYEFDRNGIKSEGEQTVAFLGMVDGEAKFRFSRSGSLSQIGDEVVVSKKDGIYTTEAQGHDLKPAILAMPSDSKVGKAWTTNEKLTDGTGNPVETATEQKIVSQEKIKTAAGEFDCLKLTMTGTIKSNGKSSPFNAEAWYAAEIGVVKLVISGKDAKGKPDVSTITLIKKA